MGQEEIGIKSYETLVTSGHRSGDLRQHGQTSALTFKFYIYRVKIVTMTKATKRLTLVKETITSKIYNVRGQKIMLDRDLAELYGVKAICLREQVKRNIERFPQSF